jgi:hypothetical protein
MEKRLSELPILVSSVRNENFYVAQYSQNRYKLSCLSLRINQI